MKDKLIQIRTDEEFLSHIEYLQNIYGLKTLSATIRFVIEKEYRKENIVAQQYNAPNSKFDVLKPFPNDIRCALQEINSMRKTNKRYWDLYEQIRRAGYEHCIYELP